MSEYHQIQTPEDVEELCKIARGFWKAEIKSMRYYSEEGDSGGWYPNIGKIVLRFRGLNIPEIELVFDRVADLRIVSFWTRNFDVEFLDRLIKFTLFPDFATSNKGCSFISARTIRWRIPESEG